MSIWKTPIILSALNERGLNTMVEHLDIKFTEIGANYLKATMPVDEKTKQCIGIMHGGASCVLAETIGSTAANFAVDIHFQYCVGLSINTHHIRSLRSGLAIGHGVPLHIGRSTQVWRIDIFDEDGHLISSTHLTMAVLSRERS